MGMKNCGITQIKIIVQSRKFRHRGSCVWDALNKNHLRESNGVSLGTAKEYGLLQVKSGPACTNAD